MEENNFPVREFWGKLFLPKSLMSLGGFKSLNSFMETKKEFRDTHCYGVNSCLLSSLF